MAVKGDYSSSPPSVPPSGAIPEQEFSAVEMLRRELFVGTADGDYLTAIGQNFGIPRPEAAPEDDETYRLIVQALAWQPKAILFTLYNLLGAVFGTQDEITSQSLRPWQVYEVNPNEVVIEIPFDLIATANENASYLHGFSSVVLSGSTTTSILVRGDATQAATTLVGLSASILISGAWEARAISSATYNPATDVTTLVTAAFSGAPVPGAPFFVDVPGDGTSSYRGDYVAQLWLASGTSTSTGSNTLTDSGLAMTTNQYAGYFLLVGPSKLVYEIVSNTATSFTVVANGATLPGGEYAVAKDRLDADEESDSASTPPHADRVYVTGDGKYEIVKQYLLRIVRASGIVARLEKI